MRSIVISIKSICFSYGWIQLLKLVSLLPVQFSNKRIICSNRKKVLHMLFIRNLYVFRPTVYVLNCKNTIKYLFKHSAEKPSEEHQASESFAAFGQ